MCFISTATTCLAQPWLSGGRRIWEIALIRRELDGLERTSHLFIRHADVNMCHVPLEQMRRALEAAAYHQRYPEAAGLPMDMVYSGEQAAQIVSAVTHDTYLVGINADCHAESITHLLAAYGLWTRADSPWQPYVVDVHAEVGAAFALPLNQRKISDLAAALGVGLGPYTPHHALDDAASARDLFDAAAESAT